MKRSKEDLRKDVTKAGTALPEEKITRSFSVGSKDIKRISRFLQKAPLEEGPDLDGIVLEHFSGDHSADPSMKLMMNPAALKKASVLVPILDRQEPTILFTRRSSRLKNHSGQISFPGGREEDGETAAETALRESFEEIALKREDVTILGFLPPYISGTNYLITPVIACVNHAFQPDPNPDEVEEIFEVPFAFFLDERNFEYESRDLGGQIRYFYALHYGAYYIWGATAGILKNLCRVLHSG